MTESSFSVSGLDNATLPRHRWYVVKEAFSPEFVKYVFEECNPKKRSLIIDPFTGSGTVPILGSISGMKVLGFEVNPFLSFVANTKLIQCIPEYLTEFSAYVVQGIVEGKLSPLRGFSTFSRTDTINKWLFNDDVLDGFEGGWQKTSDMPLAPRDILRLCLIGAALDVCNATKDGKCLRYRSDWEIANYSRTDFLKAFKTRVSFARTDLQTSSISDNYGSVLNIDSRLMSNDHFGGDEFQICIMSPPYLNSFDYTDIYRPELFLGKFLTSREELRELRQRTIRSHVQAKWEDPYDNTLGDTFTRTINELCENKDDMWNTRIPQMVHAYFEDMKIVLSRLKQFASRDASVWILISTSAYAGIEIHVETILAEISQLVGWSVRETKKIRNLKRLSGQQWDSLSKLNGDPYLSEYLLILDN